MEKNRKIKDSAYFRQLASREWNRKQWIQGTMKSRNQSQLNSFDKTIILVKILVPNFIISLLDTHGITY